MKSPAFQFYVQDFLSGVKFFSPAETGAYILLLCEQWDSGFIENNDKILKKITGISAKKLQKVVEKFEKIDNKLINKRLDFERLKKMEFIDRCRIGGEESAKKRAEEKARSVEFRLQPKCNTSLSTSTSTSKEEREKEKIHSPNFFYIGTEIYKMPVSQYLKNENETTLTAWLIQNKEIKANDIFEIIDKDVGKVYGDHNHPMNFFKSTAKEFLKSKNKFQPEEKNIKATGNYGARK